MRGRSSGGRRRRGDDVVGCGCGGGRAGVLAFVISGCSKVVLMAAAAVEEAKSLNEGCFGSLVIAFFLFFSSQVVS